MEEMARWKAKNDELEYKFNVIKKYREMRDMKMSNRPIFKMFPEMNDLVDVDNDDDDDYSDM
jgi:hypothetical protein